ncbi:MAG TPA: peptide chain release factor N(5)-glutamine methyltransferase [Prolixibacteraceae bacterium]|nr:peptide chain release factor N(5)-glutamine methyltransferase [Prolixibacteraceae bacterium]
MKRGIASVRKELEGIFPKAEIESLIGLIFEKVKGYSRTRLLLSREEELSEDDLNEIDKIVNRLKKHEPIQYILGQTEFYALPFYTLPGVLIPRPETEELVQWIIRENLLSSPHILDIGTGSGCIPVALKKNIVRARVTACDISPLCLQTARRNAELNAVQISVMEYDILNNSPLVDFSPLDIVVSNPPYVRESEKLLMEKNVLEYEPELALFVPDNNPLLFYNRIADFSLLYLRPGGKLYFEINEALGQETVEMLQEKGYTYVELRKDLNGRDRMIRAAAPGS